MRYGKRKKGGVYTVIDCNDKCHTKCSMRDNCVSENKITKEVVIFT